MFRTVTTKNKSIEIKSVSEFLEAVKQIYCGKDHQLFYRGVSKKAYFKSPSLQYKSKPQYIAQQYACLIIGNETIKKSFYSLDKAILLFREQSNDHPSIYRTRNLIENEDKMFYELTAKCPEYFKDCKTTFEHLVMMQHYGYPTRLLDITSNPLVALYFACGGLNGSNSEDGQLISYNIKKNDIRNYEDSRIVLLSNLSKSNRYIEARQFGLHEFNVTPLRNIIRALTKGEDIVLAYAKHLHTFNFIALNPYLEEIMPGFHDLIFGSEFKNLIFDVEQSEIIEEELKLKLINALIQNNRLDVNNYKNVLIEHKEQYVQSFINIMKMIYTDIYDDILSVQVVSNDIIVDFVKKLSSKLELLQMIINIYIYNYAENVFERFLGYIKRDLPFFEDEMINASDVRAIQCVLPKQNNPRLIAQQGAFLLFGFKDAVSDKTAMPVVDPKMYGELCMKDENKKIITTQSSGQKAEIVIKGSEKQKILDELKILGISNSTMFPEIDNIANELKSQYEKSR